MEIDTLIKTIEDLILCEFIDKLPYDIRFKIFKEYFEPKICYNKYKSLLMHKKSITLDCSLMKLYISIILSKKMVIEYICNKCPAFRSSYNIHKIDKTKRFINYKNGESFCCYILFYIHH
jgi:hypothetical protein